MADFDQRQFEDALDKFYRKLESLHGSVGRGTSTGKSTNGGSVVPKAGKQSSTEKEAERIQKASNRRASENLDKVKKEARAREGLTDVIEDETKAREEDTEALEKAKKAKKEFTDSFTSFGKDIFLGSGNLSESFNGLGRDLKYTGTTTGKLLSGIALGVGYAIGALSAFAKNAEDMGAFADLSKFSVGSVTQMKLMSGLGSSFTKVIEESQGRFRAFGANSQEAAENLSNLSRGLTLGESYFNSKMSNALGKDLVKGAERAAKAATAMGLSDEERAKLIGQLSRSASYGAKTEEEAQKRLVSQYSDTIQNTRTLSNTFGVSAKAILKAMEDFRNTTSGAIADISGNTGAKNIMAAVMEMGITRDQETASRIALALSKGNVGLAASDLARSGGTGAEQEYLLKLADTLQGTQGGNDAEQFRKNLEQNRDEMKAIYDRQSTAFESGARDQYKNVGQFGKFVENLGQSAKAATEADAGTSEADNTLAMKRLQGALDSLRNAVIALTATIAGVAGTAGAIAIGGIGGGILGGGGLGKIKDLYTSYKTSKVGPQLPGDSKGPGMFERIFGSKGVEDVAKVEKASTTIGGSIKDLGKGLGSFLKEIGTGVGKGIQGLMTGLAAGIQAFGNPAIIKGAAILSATVAILGAGVAAAIALIGLSLKPFASGLQELDKVSGENFVQIGAGLAAIAGGLLLFTASNIASQLGGIGSSILSFFGAKSPLEKITALVPIADKISLIGAGIKNFGEGLGSIGENLNNLDLDKFANFKDILVELSNVNVPSLEGLVIPGISTNVQGSIQSAGSISEALNNSSITPDVIAQVMAYLANIENDLQAIRGNTRTSGYEAPVKLA